MTRLLTLVLGIILVVAPGLMAQTKAKVAPKADTAKVAAAKAKTPELLDLNTASLDQLKELPGIGEAFSKKIVAGRPYARKDELVSKNVINQATYDKMKDLVIARQAKGKK